MKEEVQKVQIKIKDRRSKKIVFLAHCLINANSVVIGSGFPDKYPAIVDEVVEFLRENEIGIVQMPCPEQHFFGFRREAMTKGQMDSRDFREYCLRLARDVVKTISRYEVNGFDVIGVVGLSGSPSCGVTKTHVTYLGKPKKAEGQGIFIEELKGVLSRMKIDVPFIDFEWKDVKGSQRELKKLI